MKILSNERKKYDHDILLPCYMYEIVIEQAYSGENALERVVSKIINIDSRYRDDIDLLATKIGLKHSQNDSVDYKKLLDLVLNKVLNEKTQEPKKQIKRYQLYQERVSGEMLSIITQDIDSFVESKNDGFKVIFEKEGRKIKAIEIREKEHPKPTQKQVFEAIAKHNQRGDFIIESMDIELRDCKESIYLHCQINLGRDMDFVVTNGINGNLSPQIERILRAHKSNLLARLREKGYTDQPHEDKYKKIYGDLRDEVSWKLDRFDKHKNAKNLYDAYEMYFKYLVLKNHYKITSALNTKENLIEFSEKMGFDTCKQTALLFSNDNQDSLKSHLANLLLNSDTKLETIAIKNKDFLTLLSSLHIQRNQEAHGGKKDDTKEMDIKELNILKEILKSTSGINMTNADNSESAGSNNGIVLLEKALSRSVINRLSVESVKDLASAYGAHEICKNNGLQLGAFEDIVLNLSKVCESVLLEYIRASDRTNLDIATPDHPSLKNVNPRHIQSAKNGQIATLGAYTIIYLSLNKLKKIECLERLITLRGHSNQDINTVNTTNLDEINEIFEEIIDLIQKVISST